MCGNMFAVYIAGSYTRAHTGEQRVYGEASLGDLKGYIHNYKPRLDRKPFAADVIYKSLPPS